MELNSEQVAVTGVRATINVTVREERREGKRGVMMAINATAVAILLNVFSAVQRQLEFEELKEVRSDEVNAAVLKAPLSTVRRRRKK